MIGPLVDFEDSYYTFLIELIQIVQFIFPPVIKTNGIQYLKQLITDHLSKFKELFPNANCVTQAALFDRYSLNNHHIRPNGSFLMFLF